MRVVILSLVFFVSACVAPGETTGRSAALGGAVGAGVGGIVGAGVGDPGAGFLIGAATGAGAGTALGNVVEYKDQQILSRDEEINRQKKKKAKKERKKAKKKKK